MSSTADTVRAPVLEGWFTLDEKKPTLLGNRCAACGTYYFPQLKTGFCRNPDCNGEAFEVTPLSRTGTLWSFTNTVYQPPEPYISNEPFQPFGIAAVELAKEKMTVLGQLATGTDLKSLKAGMTMELILEPLDDGKLTWKWRVAPSPGPAGHPLPRGEREDKPLPPRGGGVGERGRS